MSLRKPQEKFDSINASAEGIYSASWIVSQESKGVSPLSELKQHTKDVYRCSGETGV